MTAQPHPTQLQLRGEGKLAILWNNQKEREYTVRELREKCPCATCREKRGEEKPPINASAASNVVKPQLLPVLSMAETKPLKIDAMSPVGNYAYSITFSDGHDSGIYTLELLRELGTEVAS